MFIFEIKYRKHNGAALETAEISADNIERAREEVEEDVGDGCIIENSKRISGPI